MDEYVVTAIDHKPKSTQRLQRLVNIESNPTASFLVDHYEDDEWDRLWWVRVDGTAAIHEFGALREHSVAALAGKYTQYQERPPQGPVITVELENVSSWSSTR